MEHLREALAKCRRKFEFYAQEHRDKAEKAAIADRHLLEPYRSIGVAAATRKAVANDEMVALIDTALSTPDDRADDPLQSYEKFDGVGLHAETIETRARIGERFLECYASAVDDPLMKGWTPADCPSEILLDTLERLRIAAGPIPSLSTAQPQATRITGPTILMGDGAYFDFEFPDASGMTIEDYAWGLAANGRFRGQTRYPAIDEEGWSPRCLYNVCQHAVLLAEQMLRDGHGPQAAFEGLMHESDEVVWGDFPGPAKALMPAEFRALVKRAGDAIDERFGVTHQHKDLVKQYDLRMLATEKRDLMPHSAGARWSITAGHAAFEWRIAAWDANHAVNRFVDLHRTLRAMLDD